MRPNYAMDPPPAELSVGGAVYPVQTDFRVWLKIMAQLRKLNLHPKDEEAARKMLDGIYDIEALAFGGVLADEEPGLVLKAVSDFSKGYPSAFSGDGGGESLISLEHDLNSLVLAIRVQYGIDLSYRRTEPFHWWEFLLLVQNLSGHHHALDLAEIRAYDGKDKKMLQRKYACALPAEMTGEELAEYEEFASQFD